jgi:hypothetical protein
VRRISTRTWTKLTPGLPLPLLAAVVTLPPFFGGVGVWQSFAAIMIMGLVFGVVSLVVGPREPVRFFDAAHLRAHIGWGVVFIGIGALLWLLRSDELRFGGAGIACLGVIYLVVGWVGGRLMGARSAT